MIGIDWGGYDYDALKLEEARSQAGIDLFISQLGGAGTPKLIPRAKQLGYITGGYYWNSALNSVQFQVDQFSKWLEATPCDIIVLDVEHWWKDWAQYWAAIQDTLPWAQVEKLPPQKIYDNAVMVYDGMKARWAGKYFLNYSAQWFVNGYSPQLATNFKTKPFWVAAYPDYGLAPYTETWQEIGAGTMHAYHVSGDQQVQDWSPTMPTGMTDWALWQYSSRIKVPGEYYAYDWNYYPGTRHEFEVLAGLVPPLPPVENTDAEKLALLWNHHPELWTLPR